MASDSVESRDDEVIKARLAQYKADYRAGKNEALLSAIIDCDWFDVPVPPWVLQLLAQAAGLYLDGHVRTLGEAFGIERPKGWRQNSHSRKGQDKRAAAVIKMHKRVLEGMPVTEAIAKIAKAMHISESVAERWYYEALPAAPWLSSEKQK